MSSHRDSLFPATSIGRSPVNSIARTASRESLAAHPLLAPSSDTTALSSNKYVPYTPRQRQATTGSPVLPTVSALPQQQQPSANMHACAARQLQLMNLKAAAQSVGLDAGSVGWAILEKLAHEGDATEDWAEIWNAVTKGKASLLLPLEQSTGQEKITPEFVRDHTIVLNTASRDDTPVVALSGLRGHLVNDILTLRSTISPRTKYFRELFTSPSSRISLLNSLSPLPHYPFESSYPRFTILEYVASLPIPPKPPKPPLPPRPNSRVAAPQTPSRISMPFASLFGQKQPHPVSVPPAQSPAQAPAPGSLLPPSTSPSLSITTSMTTGATGATATASGSGSDTDGPTTISAFTTPTSLSYRYISTSITSALTSDLASSLSSQPPWLVERVQTFAAALFPFVQASVIGGKRKKKMQDLVGSAGGGGYVVNDVIGGAEELAEKMQEFYGVVDTELRREVHRGAGDSAEQGDVSGQKVEEDEKEDTYVEEEEEEARIRDVLETVEAALCSLFYDRLFIPAGSDDSSHDAALSSRIAALNLLDLSLAHLDLEVDVDVNHANDASLDAVIRDCGQTLAQLDLASRTPQDKARVIVSAHKILVEGLGKVPPIRLKARGEDRDAPLPPAIPIERLDAVTDNTLHVVVSSPGVSGEQPEIQESALFKRSPSLELKAHPPEPHTPTAPTLTSTSTATSTATPISGDVLLPFLIFSIVKANPPNLVSHLLFTQRFRNHSVSGEEGYCLVNLMAVAEFLENVDLGVLGLGVSDRAVSTEDLTPIPIARATLNTSPLSSYPPQDMANTPDGMPPSLRGRVEQGVDVIAGSANKVISGVFDTSFGVLRALMPGQSLAANAAATGAGVGAGGAADGGTTATSVVIATGEPPSSLTSVAASTGTSAGAGAWGTGVRLLRRESGFSIAGLAASLPGAVAQGARSRAASRADEVGQRELVEVVSRPASVRSGGEDVRGSEEDEEEQDEEDEEGEGEQEGEDNSESESENGKEEGDTRDTRSIKSFESMMRSSRKQRRRPASFSSVTSATPVGGIAARKSLADRLNSVRGLSRLSHHEASNTKGPLIRSATYSPGSGSVSRSAPAQGSALGIRLPPPNRRFIECTEDDLRVSEVRDLLMEYRQLVDAVRSIGGFEE